MGQFVAAFSKNLNTDACKSMVGAITGICDVPDLKDELVTVHDICFVDLLPPTDVPRVLTALQDMVEERVKSKFGKALRALATGKLLSAHVRILAATVAQDADNAGTLASIREKVTAQLDLDSLILVNISSDSDAPPQLPDDRVEALSTLSAEFAHVNKKSSDHFKHYHSKTIAEIHHVMDQHFYNVCDASHAKLCELLGRAQTTLDQALSGV